ncbi:MAG: hypothetical protein DMG23_08085 [Acidobacteria bacterium]|nr:MAG: hypothetical protein DMG23_08085 [Acidobacteriota bacterium]
MFRRAKVRLPAPNLQLLFLLLLPAFVIATSLRGTSGVARAQAQTPAPTYAEVNSLFRKNCIACHSGNAKMGGLILESYETLVSGGAHGPVVVARKSDESRLLLMVQGKVKPQMPFGGTPLSETDIATLKAWIDAGAEGPALGAPLTTPPPDASLPEIKPEVPVASPVSAMAFSPDGKLLAVGGYGEVRLLDPSGGSTVAAFPGHSDLVRALAFSPDGKWLAAAGGLPARMGEIKIWDLQTHQLLRTMMGHKDCIYSVAVSPDGKLIASASYDKLVKLWDPGTGKEVRTLKDHIDAVFAVAFSPDGKRLASGAADRTVKIWDVASGQRLFTLGEPLDGVSSIAFRPSGNQIAAAGADKLIRTWDLSEKGGTLAQSMIAHEDAILQILYSPDGKTIISSSADRTIRIWDAASLTSIKVLEKQPDWVQAMSISPDGKRLAVGRYDGTVSIYDLETSRPVLGSLTAFALSGSAAPAHEREAANR